ncbi:MAG: hypothetical protein U0231_06895 [Nitrospiraceae bacterium]
MDELIGSLDALKSTDPDTYEAIRAEEQRQREKLLLIASENFASPAVLAAQGCLMTNKYAEGYPGKRYYGGCQHVDTVEDAIQRCKQIFGADHVNVQPHSGSQANMAAYLSVLKPGDTILGLDLAQGGHLTHGSKVNFSGTIFRAFSYGVDRQSETIDYAAVQKIAEKCRPRMLVVEASAYARTLDFAKFQAIAKSVGAYLMVDIAHIAGLIAASLHQPGALRRLRHHDDPQDPPRTTRWRHDVQGRACEGRRQDHFPGPAGRSAYARDRRQGGRLQGSALPGRRYQQQCWPMPRPWLGV